MEKEKDGVWRTIRGRRIFIAKGESLGEAMTKSGKFKREDIREAKSETSAKDRRAKIFSKNMKSKQKEKEENKWIKRFDNRGDFSKNQAEKNRLLSEDKKDTVKWGETRVERNINKYSDTDVRELRHEYIQKKLAEYKAKKQSNNKVENVYTQDKKEGNIANRLKAIQGQERYDRLYDKYKEQGMSDEKINNLLGKRPKTGLESNNKVDNEYHFVGEELYSDDPHRYDDTIKSNQARKEKFKADDNFKKEKHIGWGEYNKDGVPVYNNDIDYKGDFGWANLKTLSNDDLSKALNIQSEEYNKANDEKVGDRRTRNGRMDKIFKDAKISKYEQGMKRLNEEMQKRDMPRYNIYDKKNPNNILVSSPTKEMADKQIQDMYKTDISLQKEYGWKELPKYDYRVSKVDDYLNEIKDEKLSNNNTYKFGKQKYNTRVEKNFDNYGRVDKEEAINNEIEKTIKRYKQRKGK